MINPADVKRLVDAHAQVRTALNDNDPRKAAKLICEQFRWLLDEQSSFWSGVGSATATLQQYRNSEREILSNLSSFIDQEAFIFKKLKIKEQQYGPVIGDVFSALQLARPNSPWENPSPQALGVLKERLAKATDLICQESRSKLRRALTWAVSWKGATILGGSAIVTANVAVTVISPAHHPVSWLSVKSGIKVMRGEVDALIDLFFPGS